MTYYVTHSGRRIDIKNVSISDICLHDISHHLTKICRYGGALALNRHYSVANHSIALYYYAQDKGLSLDVQRNVLMHDAAEAYLGDIVAGLKALLPDYKMIEIYIDYLISQKYKLSPSKEVNEIVKELDTRILLDEANAFMPHRYADFAAQLPGVEPLGIRLYSEEALHLTQATFLHSCQQLNIKD